MTKISGIYYLKNKINGKMYIGKSIDIIGRCKGHLRDNDKPRVNRYLTNAVLKYGLKNFTYGVLEELVTYNEGLFKDKELYWIDYYNTTNRLYGYNLRRDSSTKMIVHEETRKLLSIAVSGSKNPNYNNKWSNEQKNRMSLIQKELYASGKIITTIERRKKVSDFFIKYWSDKNKVETMALSVKNSKQKLHKFIQYTKQMEFIKEYDTMDQILLENPTYKWQVIYGVCNGGKKSYKGYIWRMENKI